MHAVSPVHESDVQKQVGGPLATTQRPFGPASEQSASLWHEAPGLLNEQSPAGAVVMHCASLGRWLTGPRPPLLLDPLPDPEPLELPPDDPPELDELAPSVPASVDTAVAPPHAHAATTTPPTPSDSAIRRIAASLPRVRLRAPAMPRRPRSTRVIDRPGGASLLVT